MPNNFFSSNVKFLRTRQKQTQEHLAEKLSMTRSKLNCIEMAQTKSPSIGDLLKFSAHFRMSIDTLIRVDLSKLTELKLRELEAGNDVYIKGGNLRVLAISVDRDNKENVEYVPVKAKAGYMSGYNDPGFIATLPKYSLPNLPEGRTHRIFPVIGDSMLPIPDGSDVTAAYVEDWAGIRPGTPCIVILNGQQDFVFKLVTVRNGKSFLLESLNQEYTSYEVDAGHVLEIWRFHSYTSKGIPEAGTNLQQLMRIVRELQDDVRRLGQNGV